MASAQSPFSPNPLPLGNDRFLTTHPNSLGESCGCGRTFTTELVIRNGAGDLLERRAYWCQICDVNLNQRR